MCIASSRSSYAQRIWALHNPLLSACLAFLKAVHHSPQVVSFPHWGVPECSKWSCQRCGAVGMPRDTMKIDFDVYILIRSVSSTFVVMLVLNCAGFRHRRRCHADTALVGVASAPVASTKWMVRIIAPQWCLSYCIELLHEYFDVGQIFLETIIERVQVGTQYGKTRTSG